MMHYLENCYLFAQMKSLLVASLATDVISQDLYLYFFYKNAHQGLCSTSAFTHLILLSSHENVQPLIGSGVQWHDWRDPVGPEDWADKETW